MRKPKGYWNIKENVFEEAKKYHTRDEFRKYCNVVYNSARKNGWLDEMYWFTRPSVHNKKWYRENVFAEARKYNTRDEFRKGCISAYQVARKNGWLDEMPWLKDKRLDIINDKIDCVYKYYFKETNSIYVGRTIEREVRHQRHTDKKNDTVYRHAKANGLAVPPMEIIDDNLTIKEGLEREDYWKNYYKERGYNVINVAKTGIGSGAIGAIAKGKWTKKKIFEEAKKYNKRYHFQKGCNRAYTIALKNKWLDELFPRKSAA